MMKYDVVIFHLHTGVVQSFAGFALHEEDAMRLVAQLNDGSLQGHLLADWFEIGLVRKGDIVEINENRLDRLYGLIPERPKTSNERFLKTYYRRKAMSVCVACESPNLETTVHCARCAQKSRESSARSTANTL